MKSKLVTLCVIAALLVVAMGSFSSSIANAQDDGRKEVTLWHYWGDTGTNAETIDHFKTLWEASQDECSLNLRSIPTADFKRELSTAILSGNTPDIAIIDNPDFAMFADQGVLAELDDKVAEWGQADQYYDGPWSSTVWDGHNYGVPVGSNTLALYINNALAEAAGLDVSNPPQTWADLMDWAAAMTDPAANQYGITLVAERNETATFMWLPFLQQTGEDVNSLDSEGGRAALQLWVDLVENGYTSPEVVNYGFGDVPGQFMAGNAAMMINGPWVLVDLTNTPDLDFTVAPLSVVEGGTPANGLGGEDFSIFASSEVQDCAWDFITFTQSDENIVDWYNGLGFLPSRALPEEMTESWSSDPYMSVFMDQIQYARARGPLPNWPEISEVIQLMLQEALTGQVSVDDAVTNAASQIAPMLEG
ncbi:ABC transporter substrate-binding protein [Aggregatilinea lenta]|uniref:ABC transporter substrate-binding protein n=1 Tax=Aggregatilinea lenta TaxID=913108 RepID=UPI000E5B1C31|nr:ABC transporter substrate-binding protein [Aggregatilinea lenta]